MLGAAGIPATGVADGVVFSGMDNTDRGGPPGGVRPVVVPTRRPVAVATLDKLGKVSGLVADDVRRGTMECAREIRGYTYNVSIVCFGVTDGVMSTRVRGTIKDSLTVVFAIGLPFAVSLFN